MTINERTKKIEMTAAEYKKAMTTGTTENLEYRELRREFPGFTAMKVVSKKSKNDFSDLTMKDIKVYVEKHGTEEQKDHFAFISKRQITEDGEYVEAQSFFEIKEWFLNDFELKKARKVYREKVQKIYEAAAAKACA